jgi:hypothetical protein
MFAIKETFNRLKQASGLRFDYVRVRKNRRLVMLLADDETNPQYSILTLVDTANDND